MNGGGLEDEEWMAGLPLLASPICAPSDTRDCGDVLPTVRCLQ